MRSIFHPSSERGFADHGWLRTHYSFSFADWYEPRRMGFGTLRVINDDTIAPRTGFGMHPHSDMEIITIVTEGAVSHEDSMGNKYEIPAGDVQVMSAGTGVVHAELNRGENTLKLFQVWILPSIRGAIPRYDQRSFGDIRERNKFELLVAGQGGGAPLWVNQNAFIHRLALDQGMSVKYDVKERDNGVYLFVVKGNVRVENRELGPRDAMGIGDTKSFSITAESHAELLLFEVPMK